MRVLAIETSCDETAVAILECSGDIDGADFSVMGNALYSQAAQHAAYGGVYPNLAKREHQANLAPLAREALKHAGMLAEVRPRENSTTTANCSSAVTNIQNAQFQQDIQEFLETTQKPAVDIIAVTRGPGLEPALWAGINFAEALGRAWRLPIVGIDHMEGHIVSALLKPADSERVTGDSRVSVTYNLKPVTFPILALLISGGHTELVLMKKWFEYRTVGKTRDDAVGEAFDKVARLLSLPYPGGPKIAELATQSRKRGMHNPFSFPSPMTGSETCDFSFSGLKTSVLYTMKKIDGLSDMEREHIAEAFENAAKDALVIQTRKALQRETAQTLVIAGGVSANQTIRRAFERMIREEFPHMALMSPHHSLTGDNAIMIGATAYLRKTSGKSFEGEMIAQGKLTLEN